MCVVVVLGSEVAAAGLESVYNRGLRALFTNTTRLTGKLGRVFSGVCEIAEDIKGIAAGGWKRDDVQCPSAESILLSTIVGGIVGCDSSAGS